MGGGGSSGSHSLLSCQVRNFLEGLRGGHCPWGTSATQLLLKCEEAAPKGLQLGRPTHPHPPAPTSLNGYGVAPVFWQLSLYMSYSRPVYLLEQHPWALLLARSTPIN